MIYLNKLMEVSLNYNNRNLLKFLKIIYYYLLLKLIKKEIYLQKIHFQNQIALLYVLNLQ